MTARLQPMLAALALLLLLPVEPAAETPRALGPQLMGSTTLFVGKAVSPADPARPTSIAPLAVAAPTASRLTATDELGATAGHTATVKVAPASVDQGRPGPDKPS